MTLESGPTQAAFRAAIGTALDAHEGADREARINAVCTVVGQGLMQILPSVMADPAISKVMGEAVAVPMLREIEDDLNEDHDNPGTPELYRPGLRRASRTVRAMRRALEEAEA